ncbi:MAG: hypothetical protein P4L16_06640 [Chlamydiales bacterium]|nr:hypothetical protein [Chlamydiales bacterium]
MATPIPSTDRLIMLYPTLTGKTNDPNLLEKESKDRRMSNESISSNLSKWSDLSGATNFFKSESPKGSNKKLRFTWYPELNILFDIFVKALLQAQLQPALRSINELFILCLHTSEKQVSTETSLNNLFTTIIKPILTMVYTQYNPYYYNNTPYVFINDDGTLRALLDASNALINRSLTEKISIMNTNHIKSRLKNWKDKAKKTLPLEQELVFHAFVNGKAFEEQGKPSQPYTTNIILPINETEEPPLKAHKTNNKRCASAR